MEETRVRLVVFGIVQGVGFRYAAREAAAACGVSGWVRNRADGAVEIEAQGSPAAVARMTAWAERGPRRGRVDRVEVERASTEAVSSAFEIRR